MRSCCASATASARRRPSKRAERLADDRFVLSSATWASTATPRAHRGHPGHVPGPAVDPADGAWKHSGRVRGDLARRLRYLTNRSTEVALEKICPGAASRRRAPRAGGRYRPRLSYEIISHSNHMATVHDEARTGGRVRREHPDPRRQRHRQGALARAIPALPAAKAPFVAINCGAIPEQLLESELFGTVKGQSPLPPPRGDRQHRAFITAIRHVFLDESATCRSSAGDAVGWLRSARVLRSARAARAIDVRIISAKHRDLEQSLAEGQFREDLFYRLNDVSLTLRSSTAARGHPAARENSFHVLSANI